MDEHKLDKWKNEWLRKWANESKEYEKKKWEGTCKQINEWE